MYVVGLTGGIGSGKTRVANEFARLGAGLVDADVIARQVVEAGSIGLKQIQQHFGNSVLRSSGELDRAALRQIVFGNEVERQWLNQLLHPLIREQMILQCQAQSTPYTLLVIPLLVENNLQTLCARVLTIDVPTSVQIERTCVRDQVSQQQAKAIIQTQASRWQRLRVAQDVLNNHRLWAETENEILHLHQHYLKFASQENSSPLAQHG